MCGGRRGERLVGKELRVLRLYDRVPVVQISGGMGRRGEVVLRRRPDLRRGRDSTRRVLEIRCVPERDGAGDRVVADAPRTLTRPSVKEKDECVRCNTPVVNQT